MPVTEKVLREDLREKVEKYEGLGWVFDIDHKQMLFTATLEQADENSKQTVFESNASLQSLLTKIELFYENNTKTETPVISINLDEKCSECGKDGATRNGRCLKCTADALRAGWEKAYLGDKKFIIPSESDFEENDFLNAPEIAEIGKILIRKYSDDFDHLRNATIFYRWKRKGGGSGGADVLGKCVKPTGLVKHFASTHTDDYDEPVDYIIWLAADHLRTRQVNTRIIYAIVFHELLHTDKIEGKYVLRTHEFEGFSREIEEFGFWKSTIKNIADAVETVKYTQAGLFED